ncbi:MAG: 3-oxoacyl-[acyl-carrier-protein] reductase [Ignavibacteriaceae bacterium]|jgi:3-oxoacyl-[acyl-carrier protein] reductase
MNKNRRAIVTGGTRGIGRAIVMELVSDSNYSKSFSDVAFIYNSCVECADEILAETKDLGARVFAFKSDVSSFEQTQKTVDDAVEKLGGVDILVNNAGITRDNLLMRMQEKDFDDVINANLKSVFNYTKTVMKPMIKQRYGRIINISSVVGITGNAGQSNYVASKSGVIGFTKAMARELASRNITVNAIAPGFIKTDMTDSLSEDQTNNLVKSIPLKRLGTPEDVAKVVGFLCSEGADYITGQVFVVDGGMTM